MAFDPLALSLDPYAHLRGAVRQVIVDAIILGLSIALLLGGLWLLWNVTAEAWREWRDA